jgi:shikimate dehydrogenase
MTMTRRACVIGWPVAHSRSPVIHGYWLKHYGIDGAYEKEAVRPEEIDSFLQQLSARGYVGANVTLPHKVAALRAARSADEAAIAIGAANTLWLDPDGSLHAGNTDAYGFLTNLDAEAAQWNESLGLAMVLGAGGAARAVLYGLIKATDAKILLANRTRERAETVAAVFGPRVEVIDWEARNAALGTCGLLVNTTSLGMAGQPPLAVDLSAMPNSAVVADIVYIPLETKLLAAARARGLACVGGIGMLLHQAVPGFERWFGVRPEVTPELKAHVVATLGEG